MDSYSDLKLNGVDGTGRAPISARPLGGAIDPYPLAVTTAGGGGDPGPQFFLNADSRTGVADNGKRDIPGSSAVGERSTRIIELVQRYVRKFSYENLPWLAMQDAGIVCSPVRKPHENALDPHWQVGVLKARPRRGMAPARSQTKRRYAATSSSSGRYRRSPR